MTRTAADWVGNLIVLAIVVVVNVLSNALPINGQTMPEISAKYPSLFTPAGFTFSIWGLIYLCLLAFVIWQALPAQRNNETVASISRYFKANCLLNAAWLILWHHDELVLSFVFMLAILASLVLIYRALLAEQLLLRLPFSLYTGWITLATIANASVLQNAYGWDNVGLTGVQWTLLKLAMAGAIGASIILRLRDSIFAAVIAWGAYGISVMQSATPAVSGSAATLSLLMMFLIVKEGASRLMHNRIGRGHKMANEGYHEPISEISNATRDMHRAITSLMEELEAVDWYNQRVDACTNDELRAILAHNRDEEKEHAAMVLEWIRRQDPTFDKELKDFLFTDKPIAHD